MPKDTSSIRNQTVVITGGAGFIGSSLARRLVDDNKVVLVDLSFEGLANDLRNADNIDQVTADVRDEESMFDAVASADIVVHTAAILGVRRVISESRLTMEVNMEGTASVLRAAAAVPGLQRFVYFSTSEVFGSKAFRAAEDEVTPIGTVQDARWSYAISKLAGEHLTAAYFREMGLPVTTVRPFNIFGPRRTGDHAIVRFIAAALNGRDLVVHGDGVQLRSWCHIDDFLMGLELLMSNPAAVGQVFNIGNATNTVTVLDLAERIIRLAESSSGISHIDPGIVDIDVRVPSTGNARNKLGFVPMVRLDDGLLDAIGWYRRHPEVTDLYL